MAPTRKTITASARRLLGQTVADWRRERELVDAHGLLARARSAAYAELSGASFDSEDRADCAAITLAAVLADLAASGDVGGTVAVSPTDKRATWARFCGLAQNYRRDLLARREREAAADLDDAMAVPMTDLVLAPPTVGLVALATRVADVFDRLPLVEPNVNTRATVTDACDGRAPESSGAAEHVADVLGVSTATLRQRIVRGRRQIVAAHPNALDLLRAVSGTRPLADLTFARAGAVPAGVRAATATKPLASAVIEADWRTDTSVVADGTLRMSKLRGRRKSRRTAEGDAAARQRLAREYARQSRRKERAVSPPKAR